MRFFFFFFNEKETPLQSTRQLLKKTTKKKAPNPLEKEQILIRRRSPPASGDLPQASEVPLIPFPVFFILLSWRCPYPAVRCLVLWRSKKLFESDTGGDDGCLEFWRAV